LGVSARGLANTPKRAGIHWGGDPQKDGQANGSDRRGDPERKAQGKGPQAGWRRGHRSAGHTRRGLWRLKYRIDGKEKLLAIGAYPETSLGDARKRRDKA
jgi:hypothetical protein